MENRDKIPVEAEILPPDPDAASFVPLRFRFDGWTPGKQRQFLASLGETGCIKDACRRVGMSKTSAYRLRTKSLAFAAEWDEALERATTVLEAVAFERAVKGVEEPHYYHGKLVGMRRRYSDALLKLLIQRGDLRGGRGRTQKELEQAADEAAVLAGGYFGKQATREETNRALTKHIGAAKKRVRMEEERRAVALIEAGKAP